jgi:hypothetical protein
LNEYLDCVFGLTGKILPLTTGMQAANQSTRSARTGAATMQEATMLQQNIRESGLLQRIEVIMSDGTQIHVTPRVLDVLLETNRVTKFKRESGWATIGVDPIRARHVWDYCELYDGPERRFIY